MADPDSDLDPDFHPVPHSAADGAASPIDVDAVDAVCTSSRSPSPERVLRRSSRVRTRSTRPSAVIDIPDSPPSSPTPRRLEQIAYVTPAELGLPLTSTAASLRVLVHPVAAALISLHAHLTKTEVIGVLGGTVHSPPGGGRVVVVAEAFAVRAVAERELSRTGRNAYMEVELDPESSVEVQARVESKGLQVVGWYHSHPDKMFTVEPSRVDIENQCNYQTLLFKESPFVAAIIAPYNKDLPDQAPAVEFWQTWDRDVPLLLPHEVDCLVDVPRTVLPLYWPAEPAIGRSFPLSALADECMLLIDEYKTSVRRVHLSSRWRGPRSCADKLRGALLELADVCGGGDGDGIGVEANGGVPNGNGGHASNDSGPGPPLPQAAAAVVQTCPSQKQLFQLGQKELFQMCVHRVVDHAESAYEAVAQHEAQVRAERRRRAQEQRAKRSRKR